MLYMAVTADELELPLAVTTTVVELSKLTGYSRSAIFTSISRNKSGRKTGCKFVKIDDGGEDDVL